MRMFFGPRNPPRRTGFMMLELLIVVAIILVLFCLYWGGGLAGNNQRDFSACAKNLQFIHTALITYAADNNDHFPSVVHAETSEAPLALLVPKYISQANTFICPSSKDRALTEGESFVKKRISYAYVMGLTRTNDPGQFVLSDEQVDTHAKAAGARVFAITNHPPANNHGQYGGNLLMIDGSVQMIPPKAPTALSFANASLLNPKPKR